MSLKAHPRRICYNNGPGKRVRPSDGGNDQVPSSYT